MTLNALPLINSKRRRIMIITADEDIIDQIEKNNDASLLTQLIFESETGHSKSTNQQSKVQLLEQKNKTNHGTLTCVVCASPANGHNFGAIVCESCKAFFRRNARKDPNIFRCRNKLDCEITFETRRNCPACRLAKCYNNGMQRDRLLTNEQKVAKYRRTEENRALALHSNSKTNERQSQWSPSVVSDDSLTPIDTDILLLTDFTDLLAPQPKQKVLLTPVDLQRIENISLSYQKRIELATRDGLPWDPSTQTVTFLQNLNSYSVTVMRLLSFFKQIPEFNQLNVDDKVTLIKYNLKTVLGINSTLSYNPRTTQILETDSDVPLDTRQYQLVYGYNICIQLNKIFHSFLRIANYDKKIIQLSLIALILTNGFSITHYDEPILTDTMAVYRAQNYYIELLWKYMEATHGSEVAVRLFSELVINATLWQTIQDDMRDNILRTLSPKDIDELLPIIKSVWHLP